MNYFSTPFSRLESFQIRIEQLFLFELTELLIHSSAFQLQYMVMTYETNMALPHKSKFTCLLQKKALSDIISILDFMLNLSKTRVKAWVQFTRALNPIPVCKTICIFKLSTTKIKWKLTQITHRSLPSQGEDQY